MDVSTLFGNDSTGATGGVSAGGATPVNDNSAVISTDVLLGAAGEDSAATTASDSIAGMSTFGQIGDPLAGASDATTATDDGDIALNDTITTTNDWSKVGDVEQRVESAPEVAIEPPANPMPEPISEPAPVPTAMPFAPSPTYSAPGVDDPEKIAFIKTYTQEFDDAKARATDAAQKILDAIDKAVHEHSSDITVPESADEFLAKTPENGKVEKFEDARAIVSEVLARAADAKAESAKAAEEAAQIYDEVQAFKKETKDKIVELNTEPQQIAALTIDSAEPVIPGV